MITTEKISLIINRGNLPFFRKRHSEIKIGDTLLIDIADVSIGSNLIITAKCDMCMKEVNLSYKRYNLQISKNSKFSCSKKCAALRNKENLIIEYGVYNIAQVPYVKEKIKQTNIEKYGNESYIGSDLGKLTIKNVIFEKYGVDNPQKNEAIRNKTKETNNIKYGYDYVLQSPEIRKKIKLTNIEKYGFENPSESEFIKDKINKTNNDKYGGNSPMSSKEIQNKSKQTTIANYGVDSPQKSELIREKTKATNLELYGFEYPTQSMHILEKRMQNISLKYGYSHISQNSEFRKDFIITNNEYYIEYIKNKISLFKCDCNKDHNFEIHSDNFYSRVKYKIPLCTICYPIGEHKSIKEIELFSYIKSIYNGNIIQSYRDQLEIDIYLPELKIGFEFNGLYWHSEKYRGKKYHIDKTNHFKTNGIRIIHIWEDDWAHKQYVIKSQINNWLGLNVNKLFARKCEIKLVDTKLIRSFLNENHIQGYVNTKIAIGLYYNTELISIMTFDNFEGRKKMKLGDWNLSRFCTKLNNSVIGGASKLLAFFIKEYIPNRIISYADKDWSVGEVYYKLGFNLVSESKPDYKYIVNSQRVHKSHYRKSKLNTTISESKHMINLNIDRIYDCGNLKYIWNNI